MKVFDYLIHLINAVMKGTVPDEPPEGLDFSALLRLAETHSVANITFYGIEQLENKPDEALYHQWEQLRDKAVMRDVVQLTERDLISEAFSEAGIRHICLKGSVLKFLYPQTDLRTMSDIDMLIDEQNMSRAKEIMLSLGYSLEEEETGAHDVYFKRPIMNVEIHRELFGDIGEEYGSLFRDVWSSCKADGMRYEMDAQTFFLYVLAHAAKHYETAGTGIRSFLDFYVARKHFGGELDIEGILSAMKTVSKDKLCSDMLTIADGWFNGGEIPESLSEMVSFVASAGTYGTIEGSIQQKLKSKSKARVLFDLIFPSFTQMKYQYPVLKKVPILLPFCWLLRLVTKPFINFTQNKAKLRSLIK